MAGVALSALVACGGGTGSVGPATPSPGRPSGVTHTRAPGRFGPHTAVARMASWNLPFAAARQAAIPLGRRRVLLAGGLLAGDTSTDRVVRVDLRDGRVAAMPPLATAVHDLAGGLAGGRPLVMGGGNTTERDVVQALRGTAWRVVGHLPTARSDLGAVEDGEDVLAIGGYYGRGTPRALVRVAGDGSVRVAGLLRRGVRYAATAVSGHTAYVFGGEVHGRELDAVQAVDLRTGRTRLVGHLTVPVGHAMAATVGSRILLMGGRVSPDRQTGAMWWFDPGTGRLSGAGSLPVPLSDAATATRGHRVWLLGGESPAATDHVVFVNVR